MKPFAVLSLTLLLCYAPAASADESKFEPLVKEAISTLTKLTETMETIKNTESAKKAEKDLNTAVDRLLETQKQLTALGQPSEEEAKRYKEKHEPEIKKLQDRLNKAAKDAAESSPEAKEIVRKAVTKMQRRQR